MAATKSPIAVSNPEAVLDINEDYSPLQVVVASSNLSVDVCAAVMQPPTSNAATITNAAALNKAAISIKMTKKWSELIPLHPNMTLAIIPLLRKVELDVQRLLNWVDMQLHQLLLPLPVYLPLILLLPWNMHRGLLKGTIWQLPNSTIRMLLKPHEMSQLKRPSLKTPKLSRLLTAKEL
ncbi:hypothetical protein ACH5RR_040211 [Cinchona calisaya]|uniref:Uncharacterized protein n=1 Tax=Cinchona calisaya TaxID=153742 RepID=A0ABD2XWE6_9GENT